MNLIQKQTLRVVGAVSALTLAASAHAGGGFTVPTELTSAVTSVTAVGAAVFAIAVAIKLYKWFKRAL